MLVLHILSKSTVEINKDYYGYCKVYHAHSKIFSTNVVIAYGPFMVFKTRGIAFITYLFVKQYPHVGAYENNLVLIQGSLNVALI